MYGHDEHGEPLRGSRSGKDGIAMLPIGNPSGGGGGGGGVVSTGGGNSGVGGIVKLARTFSSDLIQRASNTRVVVLAWICLVLATSSYETAGGGGIAFLPTLCVLPFRFSRFPP